MNAVGLNKKKNVDQLPLKRETSRIKKNTNNSRKGSVGKIVGQNVHDKIEGMKC